MISVLNKKRIFSLSANQIFIKTIFVKSKVWPIGIMVRVFVNGPRDRSSVPGRVIPKTLKKYLIPPPCLILSTIR